ncbi:odorant receptor 45b-like [Hylaeus volcanicus]|uniref:odorant receptor 45b-like n=1 Tax=Hylaeus volcanicus TaxID=313075 RepID=UPI0023B7F84B|nr:odorant receptor 45b-like [Hylaeus volcanicus]
METPTNEDFVYAMLPLKILSWPVGTWPLQEYNFSSGFRSFATVVILMTMMIIVNVEIYLDITDAEKNLDALVLIGCGVLAVWKVAWFRICCEGLVSNFSSAVKDYTEVDGEEKRAIVRQHAYMGRVACAGLIGFSYMSSTLFTSVPMLAGEDENAIEENATKQDSVDYPIPSELTMDLLHVPHSLYPVIFVVEYAMLLVTSTGNLGSDGLFFGITFHLCGQAEVLKLDFTKFVDETDNRVERFGALTNRHRDLLKLSEKLNDIISSVLVIQLFTSCLLICTTGFQFILSLTVHNVVMVVKTFIVMSTCLTQMFAYSYVGEYLTSQMESIGYSVYSSRWYKIPNNLSKDMIFVMLRAQTPTQLKAGQFFVVNMETYMSIVKTSMSYLSVLRVMITP